MGQRAAVLDIKVETCKKKCAVSPSSQTLKPRYRVQILGLPPTSYVIL